MKFSRATRPRPPGGNPALWSSCLLLSLAIFASAAEDPALTVSNQTPTLQLRTAIQVDGQGVFLGQLLEPGTELPALRLCDAPMFGKSLLLKRAEIAELSRLAGLEQPVTNWAGPESVRISRKVRTFAEKEMLQLLTSVLQKQFVKEQGDLELRLARPWMTANVPDEPFTLKVLEIPTSGVAPAFIVRFEFDTAQGEHIGPWQAPLQAKVWREIWTAGSAIKRGELVRSADLNKERRDLLLSHEPLAGFAADDPSLEFYEPVQAGSPIFARFVRPRAIVHRGQSLAAMVHDGALMITLKVEALEDGAAGQIIRVRNPLSRRDLRGTVLDQENVLVSL